MRTYRLVLAAILPPSMLFGWSRQPSLNAAHYSVRTENVDIPWAFPPPDGLSDFCPEVPAGFHINPDANGSDRVKNAVQTNRPDGSVVIQLTDLVTGTAHDNFGNAYLFVYENNQSYSFDGAVVTAQMTDTFKLKGGPVNYTVGFNWRWMYAADSLEVIQITDGSGQLVNLDVAPFIFATNDGVTGDPDIVTGSWQIIRTEGPEPAQLRPAQLL
jgi:hypothetical protein